jgi:mttA/Hcf106 family
MKLADIEVYGMPNILFILLLALIIFGPRKLPEIVTNILPKGQPWEKLMSLMTKSVSAASQELVSISGSSAEPPKPAIAPIEPPSSLAKSVGGE